MLPRCVAAVLLALAVWVSTPPLAGGTDALLVALAAEPVRPADPANVPGVFVSLPRNVEPGAPLQVLVALHGMGGNGEQFAASVLPAADRNHWLVVAPTINYGDWMDPDQIDREEPQLISWLADYLDHLPQDVGVPIRSRVLLLGYSRGAQLAHRFALFQPARVAAVAALSAGTYTLPVERSADGDVLPFPFGVGDLADTAGHPFSRTELIEDTQFWLGVGTEDNNPSELPRQWDRYLGSTRVQRAASFESALHAVGARVVLVAFRGEKHTLSPEMAGSACSFLRTLDLAESQAAVTVPLPGRPRF
jgi:pimeloyl-ACP methyl ester carboxylesterase